MDIQRGLDDYTLDVGLTYLDNEPLVHVRTIPLYRERYGLLTRVDGPMGALGPSVARRRRAAALPPHGRHAEPTHRRRKLSCGRSRSATTHRIELHRGLDPPGPGTFSSVLPEAMVATLGPSTGVVAIPLVEPDASQSVGLIVSDRDPLTPLAAAFLGIAEAVDPDELMRGPIKS